MLGLQDACPVTSMPKHWQISCGHIAVEITVLIVVYIFTEVIIVDNTDIRIMPVNIHIVYFNIYVLHLCVLQVTRAMRVFTCSDPPHCRSLL